MGQQIKQDRRRCTNMNVNEYISKVSSIYALLEFGNKTKNKKRIVSPLKMRSESSSHPGARPPFLLLLSSCLTFPPIYLDHKISEFWLSLFEGVRFVPLRNNFPVSIIRLGG